MKRMTTMEVMICPVKVSDMTCLAILLHGSTTKAMSLDFPSPFANALKSPAVFSHVPLNNSAPSAVIFAIQILANCTLSSRVTFAAIFASLPEAEEVASAIRARVVVVATDEGGGTRCWRESSVPAKERMTHPRCSPDQR